MSKHKKKDVGEMQGMVCVVSHCQYRTLPCAAESREIYVS